MKNSDVSPDFSYNRKDAATIQRIIRHEGTSKAILAFSRHRAQLSDYAYWFILGTLWVSYSGWSDLQRWKRFFSSTRPNRPSSLMKPSELETLATAPESFAVYRAHRAGEKDWIAYTTSPVKAAEFAMRRNVEHIRQYLVNKEDVLALFLRRGESEILVLDRNRAQFVQEIKVQFRKED